MPFTKGHKLSIGNKGGGRKGYEFEKSQLERMQKILNRDLKMVEKIQGEDDVDEKTQKKLVLLQSRVLKIIDKLHVTKTATDVTTKGERVDITPAMLEIARKADEELNKLEDEQSTKLIS